MPVPGSDRLPIDLATPQAIHIVGIGGAGMRAIARILLALGHHVSGSDRAASVFLDELSELGATVHVGHEASQITGCAMVTRSTAIPDVNVEIAAAFESSIPVYSRAEMLAAITQRRPAMLVAGTHGKTTTSSMLAVVLDHAGLRPSFVIGSDVAYFGTGARWADGDAFVVEADESDGTFLDLAGAHGIVTSLDPDHLDFYGSVDALQAAFASFVESVPGTTAVCIDDPDTVALLGLAGVVSYGTSPDADLQLSDIAVTADATTFNVEWRGENLGLFEVGLPGHHNALNAGAAITIALSVGVDAAAVADGLRSFRGVARRFETRGTWAGVRFVDDYAHLPAEVEAAVETARKGPWNRVIAAYQPHRFTRTRDLGATFATSFAGVDELVLTDIYPSGEQPIEGVSGRIVYDAVVAACPDLRVHWEPTLDEVAVRLADRVGPGDLCLTLGAGDLTTVPDAALERLRQRSDVSLDWLTALAPHLSDSQVLFNEPIGPRTTYRVGGAASAVVEAGTTADLLQVVEAGRKVGTQFLALGRGSNTLVADRGFFGVALVLTGEFDRVEVDGDTATLGAATLLPTAARRLVAAGLTGFEWAVGVPGTVGGAIAMNAGGHGSDMNANVVTATVLNLDTAQLEERSLADLRFGYRTSSIAPNEIVLDATLRFEAGDPSRGEEQLSEIVQWRREHQPGGQNAGSVFTNPEGDSAGRLIDAAGGKGLRVGTAEVSSKHANFIQADPNGSADDIAALMARVIELVRSTAGIQLEPETRLVGFA